MMISPEAYYLELKGKTPEELQTCIRSLKQQIGNLKNRMENPNNQSELVCPSESTQLYWTREYLAMAKKALLEAGGEYHESAADRRAAAFLQKLPSLKRIQFAIGGYFGGNNVYQLEIDNELLHLTGQHYPEDTPLPIDKSVITLEEGEEIRTTEELFVYLREMHIEEWRASYDTSRFGYFVCDGTQWELQFEYDNGFRPWISSGSNSYPYNFAELLKLFGEKDPEAEIEDEEHEEEEKEYLYCQVTPEDINRSYSYISEIPDINPGDLVVIPYGADNREKFGTVISTGTYDEWSAPYPVEYTKKILRKADDEEIRRFKERDIEKYVYCWVVPEGKSDGYYYISEIEDLQKGEHVIIPFGPENHEIYGKVLSIKRVSEKNAPFPPDRTKRILRKVEPDNTVYEFLTVLPITHKQKTFGYINTLPDVQIGDYVEIRFRDGIRVAQVKAKSTGTIDQAPNNFMGTMEVRRKLNYENCDYIRFQAELLPLALTGELFRKDTECSAVPHRNPRLTEKAVTAFEKVYQIHLPEEYRAFVTEISNGFDHVDGLNVIDYQEEYTWMKKTFRFDDLIDRAEKYEDESPELEYGCDDRDCSECEYKDVCPDSDTFDDFGYIDLPFFDGTLAICASGDTSDRMIVNGKHVGAVIRFDEYMGKRTLIAKSFTEYLRNYTRKI